MVRVKVGDPVTCVVSGMVLAYVSRIPAPVAMSDSEITAGFYVAIREDDHGFEWQYHWPQEGTWWIRGHHAADSAEGKALLVANALVRTW